jgi:hypothetical protein
MRAHKLFTRYEQLFAKSIAGVSHFDFFAELDYLRLIFQKKRVKICQ